MHILFGLSGDRARWTRKDQVKWGYARASMNLRVAGERQSRGEFVPTTWMLAQKLPQTPEKGSVEDIHLPFRLRVVCYCKHVRHPKTLAYTLEQLGRELAAVVRQQSFRGSIHKGTVAHEYLCDGQCGYGAHGHSPYELLESVGNYQYELMTLSRLDQRT